MVSAAVLSFAARWGSPDAISRLAIHQRRELLHTAAGKGELEKVKILVEDAGLPVTADAMAAAAAAGHLPVCQWLHEQSCPWQRTDSEPRPPPPATLLKALQHSDHGQGGYPAMRAAAQAGHLDICQWLHGAGCPAKPAQILAWAASGGHVHVCEWALSLGFSWSPLALNEDEDREGRVLRHSTPGAGFREAAAGGHRALCEFMLGRGCMPFSLAPAIAIAGGHVELCEWYLQLHERAPDAHPVDWTRLPVFAAFGAELPTLQHVVARAQGRVGDAWRTAVIASIDAIVAAAASSTPDAVAKLRWLHGTQGVRILDLYAIGVAAAMGGPEGVGVLWELLAQAEAREAAEVAAAAAGGVQQRQQRRQEQIAALHALAIAHKYGEAREELGNIAAHNGRVAVLEALRGAGWEPTVDAAVKAAAAGQGDAVAWFLERIGEQCRQDPELVAAAATSGSTAVVKQLRAAGCAWGEEATWGAALHGNGELLEWLVEQGCPVGVSARGLGDGGRSTRAGTAQRP